MKNADMRMVNERNSKSVLDRSKFISLFLYMLEYCAGKPNVSKAVLCKLLYFADFNYYELYEEHLTGGTYLKFDCGPELMDFEIIVNQLIENGFLKKIRIETNESTQIRYLPLKKSDLLCMSANEKITVDKVLNQMSDWSEDAILSYTLKDMPLLATKQGDEIDYELTFYRDFPFSVRSYEDEGLLY